MVKRKPVKPNRNNQLLSLSLIITGSLFVVISTTHSFLKLRSLTLGKEIVDTYQSTIPATTTRATPTHIYSQYFLDVDIEGQVYQDGEWTISESMASYLLNSARPGEQGNIIVYGHNTRSIMGNIRAYKGGEKIVLTLSDGGSREYRVKEIVELSPNQTDLLSPTNVETLTLYTCSGFMDAKRFVVRAYPI